MEYLGTEIKNLRKAKGLTQEQLAENLGISPQAISKWELGIGTPDIAMLPAISRFFKVSLDSLFHLKMEMSEDETERILEEFGGYYWHDFAKGEKLMLDSLAEYPGNPELQNHLLDLYCRYADESPEIAEKAFALADKIISESSDTYVTLEAKGLLVWLYSARGEKANAKKIIDSMPTVWPMRIYDKLRCTASFGSGDEKIKAVTDLLMYAQQDFAMYCSMLGDEAYKSGEYQKALDNYNSAIKAIEAYLIGGKVEPGCYLIEGTQSNHCAGYVCAAACLFRLGDPDGCEKLLKKARSIPQTYYADYFADHEEYCLYAYRTQYKEKGLEEYKPCI